MKIIIPLFLLLTISFGFAQNNSNWKALKKSAHDIGYCIYNVNEVFCSNHESIKSKYEQELQEEEELYYFVMKEDWAKQRVIDWAKQESLKNKYLVLFFDINQIYYLKEKDSNIRPNNSFFILDLEQEFEFKVFGKFKNKIIKCFLYQKTDDKILQNTFWREFMTGRLGLINNSVKFNMFSKSGIQKKYKRFKRNLHKYKLLLSD